MKSVKTIITGIFKSSRGDALSKKETQREKEPIFITLEEAKQDSTLIKKLYGQLTYAKLTIGSGNNYVAGLKFKNHQYYILGTQGEWESFFMMKH
jgi:hypothetical protein